MTPADEGIAAAREDNRRARLTDAERKYDIRARLAARQLEALTAEIDQAHADARASVIDYGHVGSLARVNELMAELVGFVRGVDTEDLPADLQNPATA